MPGLLGEGAESAEGETTVKRRSYVLCANNGIATFVDIRNFQDWVGPILTILVFRPPHDGTEW